MKSILLVSFSFLLFAFAFTKPSIAGDLDATEAVLDTDGEKLRAGTEYFILPVVRGRGGGLTMASTRDETCPLDVVQEHLEISEGLPLTFTPVNPKKGVIRVSTDLNIKFSASSICVQSTVWKIQKSVNSEIQWFVTTGGVEGNPGIETITNWFKIEKTGDYYKLVFCPTVCDCGALCRDIGVYIHDNGVRTLSLSDSLQPFLVHFKKASSSSSSL
ncbi:hypothetical protein SADUNF_Sadunf04G0047300 [Salix dunnii]|uniref:Uncharacterized protein n=1 Tax=Salix dunnii TaxID=1413687 RepID=A0A835KA60_9ROSI|nr:hypothetical protein SADUNF_Sadunf04G0047300 [Salix dunnii]